MTDIEGVRGVKVGTDGGGREPWSISLVSESHVDTIRMNAAEARRVYAVLGRTLSLDHGVSFLPPHLQPAPAPEWVEGDR